VTVIVAEAIQQICKEVGLDPLLVLAIATVETGLQTWPCRFEPKWNADWFVDTKKWADKLLQSEDTEKVQQATSWGALQVMGAVARQRGFQGYLSQLAVPEIGVRFGCLHLKSFLERYKDEHDAIASYNAGSPRKNAQNKYVNQSYVDKVMDNLNKLRGVGNTPPVA
jgi:hypothetical protein